MLYRTCPKCGAHLDPGERCDCGNTRTSEMDFIEDFLFMRTRAYEIGLKGIRDFPLFVGIDENSTQRDIDEAIRAYVIGLNGEGAGEVVDIAIRMFTPEFQDYIRGLRDSCRERKNA